MTLQAPVGPFDTARCRVCGQEVTLLMAPLHIEDHKQAGEHPPP